MKGICGFPGIIRAENNQRINVSLEKLADMPPLHIINITVLKKKRLKHKTEFEAQCQYSL